jgi:hypothetical protein
MTSTTTQQRIEKLIAAAKENGATAKFGIGMTQDGNRIQRVSRANFEKAMEADPS